MKGHVSTGWRNHGQRERLVARPHPGKAADARHALIAGARSLTFILKALPRTSKLIDAVTRRPLIETFTYPTHFGRAEAQLYLPHARGRHPAVVVSLGVVPKGIEHPQVARFAEALSRAGIGALLHWSPALRDLRLDPRDVQDLVSAYATLLEHPNIDRSRSGLLGTCIGGSFALMAAADASIRDRLAFVSAYAPYTSMWTLARDIASATRTIDGRPEPWQVDPLAWTVFVRSITDRVNARESELLREAFQGRFTWDASKVTVIESEPHVEVDPDSLSPDGRAVYRLLTAGRRDNADLALRALPSTVQRLLTAMSPMTHIQDVHAPVITLLHDQRDHLIPVSESRQLWTVLSGRDGAYYTELGFQHLDPTRLPLLRLTAELPKLYRAIFPLYVATTA